MPIIAHAYYLARNMAVPQAIINSTGAIINLGIDQATYDIMVLQLTQFLQQNPNELAQLTQDFNADNPASESGPGHINGDAQTRLLGQVLIDNFISIDALINANIYERYPANNGYRFR